MAPPLPTYYRSHGARMKQMRQVKKASQPSFKTLPKAATGIQGLDEITGGGLPRGRPTLISGGAGAGKTLFGLEFLVRGATQYSEPGVYVVRGIDPGPDQECRFAGFRPGPAGGGQETVRGPRVYHAK